jgi:hypothetical protein
MILDSRPRQKLGVPERRATVRIPAPHPVRGRFPNRRLQVEGQDAFSLATWCGTCPVIFRRGSGAPEHAVHAADELLGSGLDTIDHGVLRAYGGLVARSEFLVLLEQVSPRLVEPGDADDYFHHEQLDTWTVDPSTGVPEDPGTAYYRSFETAVDAGAHLYELIVPMVPPSWNDRGIVAAYRDRGDDRATAVAYSILDVRAPADVEGPDWAPHWVLTHFLLDGHHKVEAAARRGGAIRLLSLVDRRLSIADPAELDLLPELLDRAPTRRRPPG